VSIEQMPERALIDNSLPRSIGNANAVDMASCCGEDERWDNGHAKHLGCRLNHLQAGFAIPNPKSIRPCHATLVSALQPNYRFKLRSV